ncbi:MAG: hypothetical protein A2X12_06290 [Bacteroidetes bacterium GWE2_29_8]|nr:MAG: hypothetical protein A2X12_06290 [Bacteroidetes bacterium GWE2_29_8]
MGEKLKSFFEKANALGGMKAQMRLTLLTKMSSIRAEDEVDSAENVELFENSMKELEKEFKN